VAQHQLLEGVEEYRLQFLHVRVIREDERQLLFEHQHARGNQRDQGPPLVDQPGEDRNGGRPGRVESSSPQRDKAELVTDGYVLIVDSGRNELQLIFAMISIAGGYRGSGRVAAFFPKPTASRGNLSPAWRSSHIDHHAHRQ